LLVCTVAIIIIIKAMQSHNIMNTTGFLKIGAHLRIELNSLVLSETDLIIESQLCIL